VPPVIKSVLSVKTEFDIIYPPKHSFNFAKFVYKYTYSIYFTTFFLIIKVYIIKIQQKYVAFSDFVIEYIQMQITAKKEILL